jgi:hypothetical protein
MIECRLVSRERQTAFGGLCALGHFLAQEGALQPLSGVKIDQKTVKHSPPRSSRTHSWACLREARPSTRRTQGCARTCPFPEPSDASAWPSNPPSRGPWTPSPRRTSASCARPWSASAAATPGCLSTPTTNRCSWWRWT